MVIAAFVAGAAGAALYGLIAPPNPDFEGRLGGLSRDPNELAATLLAGCALAAGTATAVRQRSPLLAIAAWSASAFCLLTIFATVSRGALIALGAMLVAAILFSGRWRLQVASGAIVVALTAVLYFAAFASEQDVERIQEATRGEVRIIDGRTTIWSIGARMVEANPVKGVGAGNFKRASRHYLLQPGAVAQTDEILETPKVAHSSYFEVLTGLGLIGLSLFLVVIVFCLRCALRSARNFSRQDDLVGEVMSRALAVALVGTLATHLFLSLEGSKQLWLLLGLAPALLAISKQQAE